MASSGADAFFDVVVGADVAGHGTLGLDAFGTERTAGMRCP
jgi:hypothetical protein